MANWFSSNWLKLVATVMVLGALGNFPYAYYQLMNWIVVGAALITISQAYQRGNMFTVWVFAFIAVLFNPFAPIYLRTDLWQVADISVAVLMIVSMFAFGRSLVTRRA